MSYILKLILLIFTPSTAEASMPEGYNAVQHFRSYADPLEVTIGQDNIVYFNDTYYKVLALVRENDKTKDEELVINDPRIFSYGRKKTATGPLSLLPAMICTLHHLRVLKIYNPVDDYEDKALRNLKELPYEFGKLKNLETLVLQGTGLVQLPVSLFEMPHLTSLDLTNNRLEFIPDCVSELKNLRDLRLGHNRLEVLNDDLGNLPNLELLDLSYNRLGTLPESLNGLTGLKTMILTGNSIRQLPDLARLTCLECLNISRNLFKELPEESVQLDRLKSFNFSHNLIPSVSYSFIQLCDERDLFFYGFTSNPLSKTTLAKLMLSKRGALTFQDELSTAKTITGWTVELATVALGMLKAYNFMLDYIIGLKN